MPTILNKLFKKVVKKGGKGVKDPPSTQIMKGPYWKTLRVSLINNFVSITSKEMQTNKTIFHVRYLNFLLLINPFRKGDNFS